MEIRTLRYFKTVCDCLSFRKAADILHISQPSLSTSIQRLEEELGVRLLYRDNRRVMISKEGAVFYNSITEVLDRISAVEDQMMDIKNEEQRLLNLAFPSTSGAWLWPELLDGFQKECPQIRINVMDMSSYDILHGIENDELEIGYGVLNLEIGENIKTRTIYEDVAKILIPAEDPLANLDQIDIEMLESKRIAMYSTGSSFCEKALLKNLEEYNVHAEIIYVRQQSTVFNLVAQGLAYAVVLDETELIRNNSLICVRHLEPTINYKCGFMWKRNRYLTSSAKKLLDYFSKDKNN